MSRQPPSIEVSVIIPCYNYGRFLPDAVASVVAQTFTAWELIIADDGSSDATLDIARDLIARYPHCRIRLLHQPNQGASATRNNSARYAAGEYIMFLDADDTLAPAYLERTTSILRAYPSVGFVYTGMRFFGDDRLDWPSIRFDLRRLLWQNFVLSHALMRKAAFEQVGGFDTVHFPHGLEDWDFWLRLAVAGWDGWHIGEMMVFYRRHNESMMRKFIAQYEWDARAQVIRKHPHLYGRRLVAWATVHCARGGLPSAAQPVAQPGAMCEVLPSLIQDLAEMQPAPLETIAPRIPFARRLIRTIPFRARFEARCWLRRAQLAMRAANPWLYLAR